MGSLSEKKRGPFSWKKGNKGVEKTKEGKNLKKRRTNLVYKKEVSINESGL